jgi:hypothetical protein
MYISKTKAECPVQKINIVEAANFCEIKFEKINKINEPEK